MVKYLWARLVPHICVSLRSVQVTNMPLLIYSGSVSQMKLLVSLSNKTNQYSCSVTIFLFLPEWIKWFLHSAQPTQVLFLLFVDVWFKIFANSMCLFSSNLCILVMTRKYITLCIVLKSFTSTLFSIVQRNEWIIVHRVLRYVGTHLHLSTHRCR